MVASVKTIRLNIDASQFQKEAGKINKSLHSIETSARKTRVSMNRIMGMGAIMFYSTAARRVANFGIELAISAEKITLLGKRMLTLTKDSDALDKIIASANEVGVSFDELSKVVGRFAVATRNSFKTDEMIEWTEGIIKSGRLVGNTQKEIQSGLTQLSQGLSAGRLMGDEFRSVMENLPLLAIEIRKQFEGDTRALKELSSQGELTADVVVTAMERLNQKMQGIEGVTDTMEAELAKLENSWSKMLNSLEKRTGNFAKKFVITMKGALTDFTDWMDENSDEFIATAERKIGSVITGVRDLKDEISELKKSGDLGSRWFQGADSQKLSRLENQLAVLILKEKEYTEVLDARSDIEDKESRLKEQQEFTARENTLNDRNKQTNKEIELLKEVNGLTDKSIKIKEKHNKMRAKADLLIKAESNDLTLLFGLYEKIDASEKLALDNLIKKQAAIESAPSACDAIKEELDCMDKLIHKHVPLREAEYDRREGMKELGFLFGQNKISEDEYRKGIIGVEEAFKGATEETDKFTEATKQSTRQSTAFEKAWLRTIKRLDNGFADMWREFVRGSITAMDFVKDIAYDFLAEMLHAFTTKKLVLSLGATIASVGTASASSTISGGASALSGASGISNLFSMIQGGVSGTGLSTSLMGGLNSASNFFGAGDIAGQFSPGATFADGALLTNGGMLLTGIAAGLIGDKIFGGYGGMGASIGSSIGTAILPGIGTAIGAFLGGAVGGLFGGSTGDMSPDLNLFYRSGLSSNGQTGFSFADNDAYFDVGGKFGGAYLSTQHDAFGSESQALEFKNSIQARMDALDGLIVSVLGEDISDEVVAEMDKVVSGEMKFEEFGSEAGGAIEAMFQDIYSKVFESISRVTGEDSYIKIFESYSGSLNEAIAAATSFMAIIGDKQYVDFFLSLSGSLENVLSMTYLYSTATDELKTAMDGVIKREGDSVSVLKGYLINLEAVNTTFERLGVTLYEVSLTGMDWANTLVEITGGIETFNNKMSFFFDNFYTAGEKAEIVINDFDALAVQFEDLHKMALPRTVSGFKDLTLALLEGGPPMHDAANAMLELSPALLAFVDAEQVLLQSKTETETDSVNLIIDMLNDRYDNEIDRIQDAKDELDNLYDTFKDIADYLDSLQLSDISILTPTQRLQEAGNQFFSTLSLAKGGDDDALGKLTDVSQSYLEEARDYYASSSEYTAIWNTVNDSLKAILSGASEFTDYENLMLGYEQEELELAIELNESIDELLALIGQSMLQNVDALNETLLQVDSISEIDRAYMSLFGRAGETAGVDFWTGTGLTGDALLSAMIGGAQNEDKAIIDKLMEDGNSTLLNNLPVYADGTDYTSSGLAYLHQGEAVLTRQDNAQLHEEIKALRGQVVILTEVVADGNSAVVSQQVQQTKATNQVARNTDNRIDTRNVA